MTDSINTKDIVVNLPESSKFVYFINLDNSSMISMMAEPSFEKVVYEFLRCFQENKKKLNRRYLTVTEFRWSPVSYLCNLSFKVYGSYEYDTQTLDVHVVDRTTGYRSCSVSRAIALNDMLDPDFTRALVAELDDPNSASKSDIVKNISSDNPFN